MKTVHILHFGTLALATIFLSASTTTRGNVYATDIKVAGVLTNGAVPVPVAGGHCHHLYPQ